MSYPWFYKPRATEAGQMVNFLRLLYLHWGIKTKCLVIVFTILLKLWNSWSLLSGVQSLGRGQYSHIVKKCWFYNIFFCTATVVGVMHFLWRLLKPYVNWKGVGCKYDRIWNTNIFTEDNCCVSSLTMLNFILKTIW